jgi:hypothetical protein
MRCFVNIRLNGQTEDCLLYIPRSILIRSFIVVFFSAQIIIKLSNMKWVRPAEFMGEIIN